MPEPTLDSLDYTLLRYAENRPELAFRAQSVEEARLWSAQARAKLLELLGGLPAERVALDPVLGEPVQRPGYTRREVTFSTRPGLRAFAYLLIPDNHQERSPAVLCLPGHGRGADDIVGIDEDGHDRDHLDGYQHDFAVQCVQKGYVALALEQLGFGHRRDPAAREKGPSSSSCQPAAGAALLLGESMAAWRTWDAMRALDYLETRPEVDPKRLAVMGISGGGTITFTTAALDDRVKAAVVSGAFCTSRDSILSRSHGIDNYIPGILRWFETADLTGLIAPRYLFVEAGTQDNIFPKPGVEEALEGARKVYETLEAPDHLDNAYFDAGHPFDGVKAFRALEKWL
ncbi:MAG TPA: alpha/beta hydrolase family protein [Isosphaeraceae bacterium]|nr:alpha/beta hydrolase family protein [Isosphaeraceae bacterium]